MKRFHLFLKLLILSCVLLFGVNLGRIGWRMPEVGKPDDGSGPTIARLVGLSELLTLRIDVADVVLARIDGWSGGIQAVIVVKGDVNLTVDLNRARFEGLNPVHRTAVLVLPPPAASSPRVDHDRTKVVAITEDGLWSITPGDRAYTAVVDKAMLEAQRLVGAAAADPTADHRARHQAEVLIGSFFHVTDWRVEVRWSDRAMIEPAVPIRGAAPNPFSAPAKQPSVPAAWAGFLYLNKTEIEMTQPQKTKPLFDPGQVVATPGVLAAVEKGGDDLKTLLQRHLAGDWGDISPEDRGANNQATRDGSRILSAYRLIGGLRLWVITEAVDDSGQRASTCFLLPEEY